MLTPSGHRRVSGRAFVRRWPLPLAILILVLVVISGGCSATEPLVATSPTPDGTRADPVARSESASDQPTASATNTLSAATPAAATATAAPAEPTPVSLPQPSPTAPATVPPRPSATPTEGVRATGETGSMDGAALAPSADQTTGAYQPRRGVIALDPGHGGPEPGAAAYGVVEKDVNLQIALKLANLLREEGLSPVLTRDSDRAVHPEYNGGGYSGGVRRDLQARVDIANEAGAVLFLSIHNNGHNDSDVSGTEVWYNNGRPFSDRNLTLARLVQQHLLEEIRGLGHSVNDRGIKDDANFRIFRGRAYNIYVLSPGTGPRAHEPTQMPGVLGESLFVSNPTEAAMLRQERTHDAIARGYFEAIESYLAEYEK